MRQGFLIAVRSLVERCVPEGMPSVDSSLLLMISMPRHFGARQGPCGDRRVPRRRLHSECIASVENAMSDS